MKQYPMTPKMARIMEFIARRYEMDGVSPSFDEIREHMGLKSKSGVFRYIQGLIERGRLVSLGHGKARALVPAEHAEYDPDTHRAFPPDRYWVGLDRAMLGAVMSAARLRKMSVNDFIAEAIRDHV